jgi:molybdenum cofactor cytidylyltransferase
MPRRIEVKGLLLAAGSGTRFGGAKLLAPLPDGTPVGVAALRNLQEALGHSVVVVRADDVALADRFRETGANVVVAEHAHEGMGASLAAGVAAIGAGTGIVVALADMPWIQRSTIEHVADAVALGASIAAPAFRGQRGHPVGFSPSHREALSALRGDSGARDVLAAHAIVLIDVDDAGAVRDVDHPEDLRR